MRRRVGIGVVAILVAWPVGLLAEQSDAHVSATITFQDRTWVCNDTVRASEVEYRGRHALHVSAPSCCPLSVAGADFRNGTIEVDLAAPGRAVPGIGFRGLSNGEWRNRIFFQRLSRGEREQEALEQVVVTCRDGTSIVLITQVPRSSEEGRLNWFHVRLVVEGDSVTIFLDGAEKPVMTLGTVLQDGEGAIGLCGSGFFFSDFKFLEESRN